MIRLTRLLHGTGTVSEAIKYRKASPYQVPSRILAFTETRRPVVFWNTTNKCNLSCAHCYISAGPDKQRPDELSSDEAKAFIDDLARIKVPLLMFTGGEPLVRDDFWEILSYATSKAMKTAVSTNGTLITKNVAKKLQDLGVEYVGISLDGAHEETHDNIRNQSGSFKKVIHALKNCVDIDLKCGIRVTTTRDNYTEIPELIELTIKLGVPRFCLYWLVPSGRGREMYLKKQLDQKEITQILDILYNKAKELNPEKLEILTVDAPQDGIYLLNKMREENHPEYENAFKLLSFTGDSCSAGDRVANVDPAGNVYPCQFAQMEKFKIGNIREHKFSEIWNDPVNPILKEFRNKKKLLKDKCGECASKDLCGGGCRIRAYMEFGDIWSQDPFC